MRIKRSAWLILEIIGAICLCLIPIILAGELTQETLRPGLIYASIFLIISEYYRQFKGLARDYLVCVEYYFKLIESDYKVSFISFLISKVLADDNSEIHWAAQSVLDNLIGKKKFIKHYISPIPLKKGIPFVFLFRSLAKESLYNIIRDKALDNLIHATYKLPENTRYYTITDIKQHMIHLLESTSKGEQTE